jgi:hypothetical protein
MSHPTNCFITDVFHIALQIRGAASENGQITKSKVLEIGLVYLQRLRMLRRDLL